MNGNEIAPGHESPRHPVTWASAFAVLLWFVLASLAYYAHISGYPATVVGSLGICFLIAGWGAGLSTYRQWLRAAVIVASIAFVVLLAVVRRGS